MDKEELIKNQFPNDEFLQSGVSQIVDKCIADLEKENAELKESADFWEERYWVLNDVYVRVANENENQLTKAKEILERLLITSCNSDVLNLLPNCSEVLRVRVEAEQFLKE